MNDVSGKTVDVPVSQYNMALVHPTVNALFHYLAQRNVEFRSRDLIERLSYAKGYPAISVGELLDAAHASGAALNGIHAELDEISEIPVPFLAFLKLGPGANARLELVQVRRVDRLRVVVSQDRFGVVHIRRKDLEQRWSGIVLTVGKAKTREKIDDLQAYDRCVRVHPEFMGRQECRELIAYCEERHFKQSRVVQRRGEVISDVVQMRARSSTSMVLEDRRHPLLARLYSRCAKLERVSERDIETIQCVRYKRGQKFRSHCDSGIDLPRLTTYLLYLNDDFTGGETYFPLLDRAVVPVAGACLRFPSCDPEGRVLWQSEHGGLPVQGGVKYALNIWVRCPAHGSLQASASSKVQSGARPYVY